MAGPLTTYNKLRMANPQVQLPGDAPFVMPQQPQGGQQPQPQQQMPQVDTSNAIQSLAQLMGPTPAEREAQERKLLENKRKMIAWTGLFDGLRQLGNLYYASKGATPQQYTDKPYQAIEQNYMQERQLNDYLNRYSQAYARQLFDWQQKMSDTERRNKIADAQSRYYDTRDEMARLKGENDRMRAEAAARASDARAENIKAKTSQLEKLTPYQVEKLKAAASKYWHDAKRPWAGGRSGGGRGSSRFDAETFANNWEEDPETFGKILEDAGIGYYDSETKKIQMQKAPSSNTIRTANQRYARQKSGQTTSKNSKKTYDNTKKLGL